jgi:ATPase family protein associated with various cellular activities (AAA)/winged helix domain-containing protein
MDALPALAAAHLLLRLQPLNRALRAAVERQSRAAARLARPDLSPLCMTEEHATVLLEEVDSIASGGAVFAAPALLTSAEGTAEEKLRAQSATIRAVLPLDQLSQALGLTGFELESVLFCAAPELDRSYERIYAFVLDDLNRRYPCVELLASLTAASVEERLARRSLLSRWGRLRRLGVLQAAGDSATEWRQELRLAPGVFEFLLGLGSGICNLFRDPAEVNVPDRVELPAHVNPETVARLASSIVAGRISIAGIWGPRQSGSDETVLAIAAAAGRPLRRLLYSEVDRPAAELELVLRDMLLTACGLGAILWLSTDALATANRQEIEHVLAAGLARSPVPILLTGQHPWRPRALLEDADFAEVELDSPVVDTRETMWSRSLPELDRGQVEGLAARYSLSSGEVRAVSRLARTRAYLAGNGRPAPVSDHVDAACAALTRRRSYQFASTVQPKRGPGDLVLPADTHQQVLEVAAFFRAQARVDDTWGFGRLTTGAGGIKALFTGEPGTGKTLAAEVIAGLLALPLCKVDLARIVSKWVGETEKNLESVFREAEDTHAVLFFDEAEALFGKRAEVQHGADRYANLEVSYLLQRLENCRGLVILASNLKDQIDNAFIRRFQVAIHFPRPEAAERRRIWGIAFPDSAPLSGEVDRDALARLDMTGAGIVNVARTAALLAADSRSETILMAHVVRALARQFRREARVLSPADLGPYAPLLKAAP